LFYEFCQGSRSLSSSAPILEDRLQALDDGTKINYCTTGSGGHVLLLLPGALGTGKSDFTPQLQGLNSMGKLTLVAWDPPGYGKSRPPNRTFPQNFFERDAQVAMKFMKAIGHDKFSVLGWSDGGITALFMAAMYTQNIKKMVAHAANSYFEDEDIDMILKVKDVSHWSQRMRAPMEETYGVDYFPQLWNEWTEAMLKIANSSPDKDICRQRLSEIRCPSLVIHGSKDAMVASEHPDLLHKRIKGSKLVIFPDGKHNLHFKYKDRFNEVVEKFLLEK